MDKTIKNIVTQNLGITNDVVEKNSMFLNDLNSYYCWNPSRGGKQMIINKDAEKLVGSSSINRKKLIEDFKGGKRN